METLYILSIFIIYLVVILKWAINYLPQKNIRITSGLGVLLTFISCVVVIIEIHTPRGANVSFYELTSDIGFFVSLFALLILYGPVFKETSVAFLSFISASILFLTPTLLFAWASLGFGLRSLSF